MQRGILLAWGAGMGVLAWREARVYHKPPAPGRILTASAAFLLLALVASYPPAERAATLAAWGLDLAVLLAPGTLPGTSLPAAGKTTAAGAQPPPAHTTGG